MLYFIYHKDRPNSLKVRTAARVDHLAYIKNFNVLFAGPTMDEQTGEMDGSVMVVDLPNPDALKTFIENDPYTQAGLFESSVIKPWKQVIPDAPEPIRKVEEFQL